MPQVCALARNDMQKLGRCLRWQGGNARWKVPGKLPKTPLHTQKRRCLLPVIARNAAIGQSGNHTEKALAHAEALPVFYMSLRGAKRRGNPHPCRETEQIGCCLGEFVNRCEFASITAYCSVLPQENGLPQVCALARNDMQKLGRCLRWQGGNARWKVPGKLQKTPLHTQKRRCFLPVIARSEATWQSASLQRNRTNWLLFGRIRKPLRIRLNHCLLFCVAAGERIATGVRTGSQRHAKTWPVFALARGKC